MRRENYCLVATRQKGSLQDSDSRKAVSPSYASIEPKKRGGLKMLVLDTVVKNKGQLVSSTEVERLLLQSGYKPSGKHFDISVYQTLQRLADKKLINRIKDGSKVRFASKSE